MTDNSIDSTPDNIPESTENSLEGKSKNELNLDNIDFELDNPQIPANVITELDEHQTRTAMTLMGLIFAVSLTLFAISLSYKIYQAMGTEHEYFAVMFGIPLNIVLYILVYKSLQVGKGELAKDEDGNEGFFIGKSSVLPVWLMIPLKIIATIIFGFAMYIGVTSSSIYLIFTSLILLLWTHCDYLKTRFSWINENTLYKGTRYIVIFMIVISFMALLKNIFL